MPTNIRGKYKSTPPTLTEGETGDVQLTSTGDLRVALSGDPELDQNIEGDTAHNAADTGNPVKVGGKGSAAEYI